MNSLMTILRHSSHWPSHHTKRHIAERVPGVAVCSIWTKHSVWNSTKYITELGAIHTVLNIRSCELRNTNGCEEGEARHSVTRSKSKVMGATSSQAVAIKVQVSA